MTGAGRGLGKRFAIGFAKLGARVVLLSRSKGELDAARLEIEHGGGNALRILADVRDREHMSAAVDRIGVHFGPLDVVVCAAGVLGPIGPFDGNDFDLWREAMETNVIGVANTCRAVLPSMKERRSGKIIVIAGPGAETGRPNFSAYAASKTAAVRFAESIAAELTEFNVQVNCLHPGSAYTSATDEILRAGEAFAGWKEIEAAQQTRINGGPSPDRQMEFVQFLASEASNHMTGMFITVNDDLRKLSQDSKSATFTLRRVQKS